MSKNCLKPFGPIVRPTVVGLPYIWECKGTTLFLSCQEKVENIFYQLFQIPFVTN
jgi:hypothetical protein